MCTQVRRQVQSVLANDTDNTIDIKPNNILVNYGRGSASFDEVQLGDCGDVWMDDPSADPFEGHVIGATIFRSPEAMLNLRWRAPTDIWSFGTTASSSSPLLSASPLIAIIQMISFIWGHNWHIFNPEQIDVDSPEYPLHVLIKQVSIFGPVPLSFQDIADDERLEVLTKTIHFINDNNLKKPFHRAVDKELSKKDRDFICRIMKLDPRDRPTAKELLKDEWFEEDYVAGWPQASRSNDGPSLGLA